MTDRPLVAEDLPLGTIAPDDPYNLALVAAIGRLAAGDEIPQDEIAALDAQRSAIFSSFASMKADGMESFARHAVERYGFRMQSAGGVAFEWKRPPFNRIGWESDFYASRMRELAPVQIDHGRDRIVVFATGRAFAEKNARLGDLSQTGVIRRARDVVSAQVHLVETRLLPPERRGEAQVVGVAYDMVTSEEETPAVRLQQILDPSFTHPVAVLASERIFGGLITDAGHEDSGCLLRRGGRIRGDLRPEQQILDDLRGLVLVGASVGCIITFQTVRWLDHMLIDLGAPAELRDEVLRSVLIVNLGPTTVLPRSPRMNLVSVINRHDEFVVAGNDVAPLVRAADEAGSVLAPVSGPRGQSRTIVLDAPGTITRREDGLVLDPDGSHFGHSMKHYSNELCDLGLAAVVGRALDAPGPFYVDDLIADASRAGELRV